MAFPGNPGLPPGLDPNAGMSDQERQMVRMVRLALSSEEVEVEFGANAG
jgi:import inner membrane translocase subunit TIM22